MCHVYNVLRVWIFTIVEFENVLEQDVTRVRKTRIVVYTWERDVIMIPTKKNFRCQNGESN